MSEGPVLEIRDLVVEYKTRQGSLRAVDGVSFSVGKGEILGLVGESGSGKSITGLAVLGLIDEPGRITAGSIKLRGEELTTKSEDELTQLRGRDVSMVFQDPMNTLNPVLRVDTQMIEAIRAHEKISHRAACNRAREALVKVGITAPDERLASYPHQFSGGMRQRIAIAIALMHRPALLIADEPTTALDVSIQSQILAEVQALARDAGTALVWVTHDLSVVAGLADRVAVMYSGRIIEEGPVAEIIERPNHQYTAGLIASVPSRNRRGQPLKQIPGIAPSPLHRPEGCAFAPRCSAADAACSVSPPVLTGTGHMHWHRCFHPCSIEEVTA
jgi:peptide/nickel transport system ATP-binding protein